MMTDEELIEIKKRLATIKECSCLDCPDSKGELRVVVRDDVPRLLTEIQALKDDHAWYDVLKERDALRAEIAQLKTTLATSEGEGPR